MSHIRTYAPLAVALLLYCLPVFAQEPKAIPPDVAAVVTGGTWSSGALNGVYRVVVRTGGREHTVSYAQIDWIADSGELNEEPRVIRSEIARTGSWRLDRPRILRSGNLWRAEFDGLETHFDPAARGKWIVRLGPPGELKSDLVTR